MKANVLLKEKQVSLIPENEGEEKLLLDLVAELIVEANRGKVLMPVNPSRDIIIDLGLKKLLYLDLQTTHNPYK